MAQPISSSTDLRARLAIMEQKLRSNISNMARSTAMRCTTLTSNVQNRGNSSRSEVPVKVIAEQQPSQQNREKQQATTETKKYEGLSKPDGKSFKWTAPVSNSGVIESPSGKRVASITVTSPAILPGTIEKVSNKIMSTQSSTSKLGLTPPIPKEISSLTNDASKFSGLLARIRSVNAEVANSYSEVFSGRGSGSGSTNSSSNSWTTPDASKKLLKTKKPSVSKIAGSNIHKWESSSVKRKRKDLPVKRSRTEDVEKSAGKNKKKKRCWNKKEGDFTFIPIATHQYCMFFNKFGSCRSGSSCVFKHDPSKVAVCRSFLQNRCTTIACPLCHVADPDKVPDCEFFSKELCFKDNCVYRHIKFNDNTEPCSDFLNGFCPLGKNCKSRHLDKASAPVLMKKKKSAKKKKKEEKDRENLKKLSSEVVRLEFLEENEDHNDAKKQNLKNIVVDMVETDLFIPLLRDIGVCDYNDVEDGSIQDEMQKKNDRSKGKESEIRDLGNSEKSSEKNSNSNIQETDKKKNLKRKSLSVKFLTNDLDDDNGHREKGTYVRATGDSLLNSISSEGTVVGLAVAQDDSDIGIVEEVVVEVEVDPGSPTKTVEGEAREIITELKSAGILQFFPTSFLFSMTR